MGEKNHWKKFNKGDFIPGRENFFKRCEYTQKNFLLSSLSSCDYRYCWNGFPWTRYWDFFLARKLWSVFVQDMYNFSSFHWIFM